MGMCSDPPAPPDMSGMSAASEYTADIARQNSIDQLDWAKDQDKMNRAFLEETLGYYKPIMQEQFRAGMEDRRRYEEVFLPWENDLIEEAASYDTQERREQKRGEAIQDVNQSFEAQRAQAERRLEGYGIDPSETRNQALDLGLRVEQAKAQAGAANAATAGVENMGRALRSDILNIGKGMPSQVAQSYGQVINAGQAGVSGGNQTTGASSAAMQGAGQGLNTALSGYNQSANITNMGYQNALSGWQAKQAQTAGIMSAVGGVGGSMMGAGGLASYIQHDGGEAGIDANPRSKASPPQGKEIRAILEEGEYIVPREVVALKGTEFFDKLVEKHAPHKAKNQAIPTKGSSNG